MSTEPDLDFGDAVRVGRGLGFREKARALAVRFEHEVDQRRRAARRLLLDLSETHPVRDRTACRSRDAGRPRSS